MIYNDGISTTFPEMVFQDRVSECGFACIEMFSEQVGMKVDKEFLRKTFDLTSSGLSLLEVTNILKAAGIAVLPIKFDVENIRAIPMPAILHFGGNHYVHAAALVGNHIKLYNPANGDFLLPVDQLKEHFTGYAVIVDKLNFKKSNTRDGATKKKKKTQFINSISIPFFKTLLPLAVLGAVLSLLVPMLFSTLSVAGISEHQADNNYQSFIVVSLLVLFSAALQIVTIRYYMLQRLKLAGQWSVSIFSNLLKNNYSFFEHHRAVDISQRFGFLIGAITNIGQLKINLFVSYVLATTSVIAMYLIYPLLGVISSLAIILYGVINYYVAKIRQPYHYGMQEASVNQDTIIHESVDGISSVISGEMYNERIIKFSKANDEVNQFGVRLMFVDGVQNTLYTFIGGIENVLMLAVALLLFSSGGITVGQLFAFVLFKQIALNSASAIYFAILDKKENKVAEHRGAFLLASPSHEHTPSNRIKKFNDSIEFQSFDFYYPSAKKASLKGNIRFYKGDKIAVIGESGSGKSTLLKLMAGFYEDSSCKVSIDNGLKISNKDTEHLFYYQPQEAQFFSGNIYDNVTLFDARKSDEAEKNCAKLLLSDPISKLPHGYMTVVSQSHPILSAGQQQRLMVARALCSSRSVLLLDEPTANLDYRIAKECIKQLIEMEQTIIMTIHDLSMLDMFDRVIKVVDGEIIMDK